MEFLLLLMITLAVLKLVILKMERIIQLPLDENKKAYVNVPWTDNNTTYEVMTPATANTAGKAGLVPAPKAGDQGRFLQASGGWGTPANTTYSKATDATLGLVKIGYTTNGKNYPVLLDSDGKMYVAVPWTDTKYNLPAATPNSIGGVKQGPYDPLLAGVASPVDYITQLDNQIQQLTAAKSQIQSQLGNPNQNMQPAQPVQPQQVNLWDEIDKEVCSLNNDQQAILAKDNVYNNVSAELQMLIQQELINSVRDKVANSPRGKELLEKQLNNIRAKKDGIIEEANKELELFKKFQIAAQANPKLTYVDFCNNIKNKEV